MGGPRINRWTGVKQAIDAIVNDTTLTTGAHFGFGHWNAGESGKGKKVEEAVCIVIKMTGVFTTVAGMVLTQTVEVNYATATLVLMLE